MSNFNCEQCGTVLIDSPDGYVTGCVHYPKDDYLHPEQPTSGEERAARRSSRREHIRRWAASNLGISDETMHRVCYMDGFDDGWNAALEYASRQPPTPPLPDAEQKLRDELAAAERERAVEIQVENVTERIRWVIDACNIDRDAKHELECVIENVQSLSALVISSEAG